MFERILLEPEQKDLLSTLVEAARNLPRDQRRRFVYAAMQAGSIIQHPGLPNKRLEKVYEGDLNVLIRQELISPVYGRRGGLSGFDVTPLGFKYYEQMKKNAGEPIRRVESTVRFYLETELFRKKYPEAYRKWAAAETVLWESDSESQLTTVGHLCREAMQEFATELVDQHQPPGVEQDKARTWNRLKAVLDLGADQRGETENLFLGALHDYWTAVDKLAQRQEHGAQKEGEVLVWEDGRRLVFQTAVVMFEIDRSLSWIR